MKRVRIKKEGQTIVSGKSRLRRAFEDSEGDLCIEIKKWSGMKTWPQIKAIHGVVIPAISEFTGETQKEVKRRLKLDYGVTERFEKNGEQMVEIASFASYTKQQMKDFIDSVLMHCEHDLDFIIDLETRELLTMDKDTGELRDFVPEKKDVGVESPASVT